MKRKPTKAEQRWLDKFCPTFEGSEWAHNGIKLSGSGELTPLEEEQIAELERREIKSSALKHHQRKGNS